MIFTHRINDEISLSPLNPSLAKEHFAVIDFNREFFGQWFAWVDNMKSEEDSYNFINAAIKNQLEATAHTFHILYQGQLVG